MNWNLLKPALGTRREEVRMTAVIKMIPVETDMGSTLILDDKYWQIESWNAVKEVNYMVRNTYGKRGYNTVIQNQKPNIERVQGSYSPSGDGRTGNTAHWYQEILNVLNNVDYVYTLNFNNLELAEYAFVKFNIDKIGFFRTDKGQAPLKVPFIMDFVQVESTDPLLNPSSGGAIA